MRFDCPGLRSPALVPVFSLKGSRSGWAASVWFGIGNRSCGALVSLARNGRKPMRDEALKTMLKFILWCILLVLCWPLALLAVVLFPLVWLLLLPFRVVGIAVGGVLELVKAIIFLPARVLRAI